VEDVLAELATRHDLYLMTKGAQDEQARKIEASGLADDGILEVQSLAELPRHF
jgi:hypothetical protein